MDPDAVLEWIVRLCDVLDAAIAAARPLDPDAVYTLVGLVEELDAWLAAGHRAPARWGVSLRSADVPGPLTLESSPTASNDAPTTARRRRPPVRTRASSAQLALPLHRAVR